MKKLHFALFTSSFFLVLLFCRFVCAIEEYKTEDDEARAYNVTRTVKSVEGLHFSVEEDRPIEKIAGVYRPIDLDSYIALKFGKLQKSIDELALDLQQKIDALAQRLDVLTKEVDELVKPPAAPPQNQTNSTNP
ncbi:MAG: hypothetical protein HZB36_04565 [Candidatus Omnitrophica bacterium]|nr:hypothetical protein [Candidatus Omnitrophota bacterium]